MTTISLPEGRFIEGSLPLYAGISLLTAEAHGDLALTDDMSFGFAAGAPTVPLTANEFARAALDYPIVFVGPARRAFAIMGLGEGDNAFVDSDGQLRPGRYIPAYLRRHPFVLVRDPGEGTWVMGVDERSIRLVPRTSPGTRPLFEDGAPTDATREVVAFCEAYEAASQQTERLVRLLDELDLFESRQAHHRPRLPDGSTGEPQLLLDYVAVSRAQLDQLDRDAWAQLREGDALGAVYAHLISEANWARLAIMAGDPRA